MGSREKEFLDLNEPANGGEENKLSNVGSSKVLMDSSNPHKRSVLRFQPLNRTKKDQKRENRNNSVVEKEEGEWSDDEGFNDVNRSSSVSEMSTSVVNTSSDVNNVKGEDNNRASLGLDVDSNNLEDSVLVPKRREIRGAEQIHALKIATDPRKRPKVDQQKVMLGKKRVRQTMFLDLEDVKQAAPAKIPTPRRPNFLPPSTTRFPKESRPVIDFSEGNGEKVENVVDQSNNEGNNYVESSGTSSECNDDDMDSGPVTRFKKTNSETNLAEEDKPFSDHKQSLLKQPADSRQMKNSHVPIKKPPLMSQNHIDSKALLKRLPSRKPITVTNQYQDSSVERLLREVTNEKFWQHPGDSLLRAMPLLLDHIRSGKMVGSGNVLK